MIYNTFIYNPIRPDYIHRCLDTLYKYTDMENNRVIVVDQTMDGLELDMSKVHLLLRPHRNLGFSKSMNEAIIHSQHWGSKYTTVANDDIEYIDSRWWQGIEETFAMDERVIAVNPMSPKEPGWGYGRPHGEYLDLIEYKSEFSTDDYDYLLEGDFRKVKKEKGFPQTFPDFKRGVIDAIATWHTTFKTDVFDEIGLFDERFYPGGGEDYCFNAGAYSCHWGSDGIKMRECCDEHGHMYNGAYRMVGTTKSWVYHFWGSSKDHQENIQMKDLGLPILDEYRWNNPDAIFKPENNEGHKYDPWGHFTDKNGKKKPLIRERKQGVVDI